MSTKTRSSLGIDAVASAAALGSAHALNPLRKLNAIAALAGFVLRLCRSKQQVLPYDGPTPAKAQRSRPKGDRTEIEGKKGGLNHG